MLLCYKRKKIEIIYREDEQISYAYHIHCNSVNIITVLQGEVIVDDDGAILEMLSNEVFVILPFHLHKLESKGRCKLLMVSIPLECFFYYNTHSLAWNLQELLFEQEVLEKVLEAVGRLNINDDFLERIRMKNEYIASFDKVRTLEEMAAVMNYSKFHFLRKFKECVKLSPHKLQQLKLVRRSQEMFFRGNTSAEVINSLNYYDQSHFIKRFKEVVGCTPLEYIEAIKYGNKVYEIKT